MTKKQISDSEFEENQVTWSKNQAEYNFGTVETAVSGDKCVVIEQKQLNSPSAPPAAVPNDAGQPAGGSADASQEYEYKIVDVPCNSNAHRYHILCQKECEEEPQGKIGCVSLFTFFADPLSYLVHGEWSEWGSWDACENSIEVRTRECKSKWSLDHSNIDCEEPHSHSEERACEQSESGKRARARIEIKRSTVFLLCFQSLAINHHLDTL